MRSEHYQSSLPSALYFRLRHFAISAFHTAGIVRLFNFLRRREWPKHPIDKFYSIETSKRVSRIEISTGLPLDQHNVGHLGAQPSILRSCLKLIPRRAGTFIDLGCGKGRAVIVATEFDFSTIVGIEISRLLVGIARRNAAAIRNAYPQRPPITIIEGDASNPTVPNTGDVVLFCYNALSAPLIEKLIENLEDHCALNPACKIWLVYYNPVHYLAVDRSSTFKRYFAGKLEFESDEAAASRTGNTSDSVLIYQARTGVEVPAILGATANVTITIPNLGAEIR